MVSFAGWEIPVMYSSIIDEHKVVREKVGVFDISQMGQAFVSGEEAAYWWDLLMEEEVAVCGLGSRDSLRLEMCYPLHRSRSSP